MKKFLPILGLAVAAIFPVTTNATELVLGADQFKEINSTTSYKSVTYTAGDTGLSFAGYCNNGGTGLLGLSKTGGKGNWFAVSANTNGVTINSVVITAKTASGKETKLTVYGNDVAYSFTDASIKTVEGTEADSFTMVQNEDKTFTADVEAPYFCIYNSTSTGQVVISKIVINYTPSGSTQKPAELSYETASYTIAFGDVFQAPELINPNLLPVTYTSSDEAVATVSADGKVIIGGEGTTTITAASEETAEFFAGTASYTLTVTPAPVPAKLFEKVTSISTGNYLFVADVDGTLKYGEPINPNYSYGRLSLKDAVVEDTFIKENGENTLTLTVSDDSFTIQDSKGQYYGMDADHMTNFQIYADVNDGCYWTYSFNEDGTIKLVNKLNTDCYVGVTKGSNGTWYTNMAPAQDPAEIIYPSLYKERNSTAVKVIETENGEAAFYNLQGVRVANPEKGLYIRIQNGKATKILVK